MTYFHSFGTPSISREVLKLETSNLAHILAIGSPNEKNAKFGQKGVVKRSRDLPLEFWDPSISRERLKVETSNLTHRMGDKNAKIRSKGVVNRSRDILLEIWNLLHISGTVCTVINSYLSTLQPV